MSTAIDLITRALRTIGVLGIGETPDSDQANNGLITLNSVCQDLSNQGLMQFAQESQSIAMTGASSLNMSPRFISLDYAVFTVNGVDYPVNIRTQSEYLSISNKSATGNIVTDVYFDSAYPTEAITIYPVCSTGTLKLYGWSGISTFPLLTTAVSLPPGYEEMLVQNTADLMQSEYGKQRPKVTADAARLKANIKRTNHRPRVLGSDYPNRGYYSYDIKRGY